ncbi:MAG: winged helix-turn-helix domain-containing protein [Candidatus Bathyarchaeia archaeon]
MYKCNLSWENSREILNSLLKQNLVSVIEENGRRLYKLTEKGREVLEHFSRAQTLLVIGERKRRACNVY